MTNINADGSVETPSIDWEARAMKAEAKIVDMKATTEAPKVEAETPVETPSEVEILRQEMNELKASFASQTEEIQAEQNQDISNSMSIAWTTTSDTSWGRVTTEEFGNMSPEASERYMAENIEDGNVMFAL